MLHEIGKQIENLRLDRYKGPPAAQFAASGVKRIVFKEVAHDLHSGDRRVDGHTLARTA